MVDFTWRGYRELEGRQMGSKTQFFDQHFEPKSSNEMREGKARVPDVVIYSTAKKLVAPSIEEGFDELLCVRPNDTAFEVRGC